MTRLQEIEARLAEIQNEIDSADEARLDELNTEVTALKAERSGILAEIEKRQKLRNDIANGSEGIPVGDTRSDENEAEKRAKKFAETKRTSVDAQQARAVLMSGGTLVAPTKVNGINDIVGSTVSSIVDLVSVQNCVGMGANRVAYISAELADAAVQTEGQAGSATDPTFAYIDITPTSLITLTEISDQARKQSPLAYESKVKELALKSLRRKTASTIYSKMLASTLTTSVAATVASNKGKVDENTIRRLVLAYGGNEAVEGNAYLFLNKTDLVALGDIRGSDKKAVYEIIPDASNPNTGVIKDGGVAVKYCLANDLTACDGTSKGASAIKTMFYGNPKNVELDLFSDFEISVSEDFKFSSRMETIRGVVDIGADVVAQGGFVVLTIPAT